MRTYRETHPWINFQFDMRELTYKTWLMLGKAQAKCEDVANTPILPALAEELHQIFLAKGALATTAIEGNTLTEEQVQLLLENKLELPPSKDYLRQEVENIIDACNEIMPTILIAATSALSPKDIKHYNAMVLRQLPLNADEDIKPGELREHSVTVGRYRGAPAEDLETLLTLLCDWLNRDFIALERQLPSYKVGVGILKAIIAHVYIAWIHPFADGNGRTARLIEFQILLASGVPTNAAQLLSNHYNETRSEYYRHLDQASKHERGLLDFIDYALQGFVDQVEAQLSLIQEHQLRLLWRNHVYDQFKNNDDVPSQRRRRLLLDLADQPKGIPLAELRYLTPRLAEAYADKTDKTIQRDIQFLEEMQLITKEPKNVIRARLEIMRSFIPARRK